MDGGNTKQIKYFPTWNLHSVWKTDNKHKNQEIPNTLRGSGLHCEDELGTGI